jgi:hypothetical protein
MRPWRPPGPEVSDLLQRREPELSAHGGERCLFLAEFRLPSEAELGTWQTFLYAQTLNDVPQGTSAVDAAQTIGGLPVTHNFVDAGRTTHILYGASCNISLQPDGEFEVVEEVPPVIG